MKFAGSLLSLETAYAQELYRFVYTCCVGFIKLNSSIIMGGELTLFFVRQSYLTNISGGNDTTFL